MQRNKPRKSEHVKTDAAMEKEKKNDAHKHARILAEAINTVCKAAIFVVPSLTLIGFLIYVGHLLHIRDWEGFTIQLSSLGKYTIGGVLAWLAKNKMDPKI